MDLNEVPFSMDDMTEFDELDLAVGCWKDHGRPPHHGRTTEAILKAISRHPGVLDDLLERERQIHKEGWTPEHDDVHGAGELADAASAYAYASTDPDSFPSGEPPTWWPWESKWWKSGAPRRMLVKARALLLAEIERLDRRDAPQVSTPADQSE